MLSVTLAAALTLNLCAPGSPDARWKNGPPAGDDFFPIAVWLQAPRNAKRYRDIGINLYVGLHRGPTEEQLDELERHGMAVICSQNAFARAHLDRKVIVGWMHGDEPDNAQPLRDGKKGYGPPVPIEKIIADYERIHAADPTRPVLLNLGQGVAWDGWHGRGVRSNHPEDYWGYVKGSDIGSFDIYPAVHDRPEVAGKLWYVARGVQRLREWAGPERVVWNCIECTRIGNKERKPSPAEVKAEVWMSIVHGSRGIIYFCHQFEPRFIEAALLEDDGMREAVTRINREIRELAPIINGPPVETALRVDVDPPGVSEELSRALGPKPIATLVRKRNGATYVFAVRMEASPARASFGLEGLRGKAKVEVLGEGRTLEAEAGRFSDAFEGHAVHLYRID
jgi:hypothetical protein